MRSRVPTCTSGRPRRGNCALASCALVRPDSLTKPAARVVGVVRQQARKVPVETRAVAGVGVCVTCVMVAPPIGFGTCGPTRPDVHPCELQPSVRNVRFDAATLSSTPNLSSQFWLIRKLRARIDFFGARLVRAFELVADRPGRRSRTDGRVADSPCRRDRLRRGSPAATWPLRATRTDPTAAGRNRIRDFAPPGRRCLRTRPKSACRRAVTRVKLGPRPRRLICWPSPFVREICTPGMRAMASARLLSGSLPTSSAEMESMKFVAARLVSRDFSRLDAEAGDDDFFEGSHRCSVAAAC